MTDAVFHPSLGVAAPYAYSSHWGAHGGNHVTVYSGFPRRLDAPEALACTPLPADRRDPVAEAIQAAREVSERLVPLVRALPARLTERLGFVRATLPSDWAEVLFHLGWHFPDCGIEAGRFRILAATTEAPWDFRCPESELQLGGVCYSVDAFPGVIVSRLGEGSDFLSASVSALQLMLEAVEGVERDASPRPSDEFGRLRDTFSRLSEAYSPTPHELSVQVLRLADSFRTPPATEWAGIERGGDGWGIPKYFLLSHQDANRVVCALRGPGMEEFEELANRAGALLPTWPAQKYPAVLNDVCAFARYCDPERFPWAAIAGDTWNEGMVTDHRGNVERWLGLVFAALMAHRLDHLNLMTRPEGATQPLTLEPVNAMLTLRGMDLFAASARAIELAGLMPSQGASGNPPPQAQAGGTGPVAPQPPNAPAGVEGPRQTAVPPAASSPVVPAEIERLSSRAREEYAKHDSEFTLIAVPSAPLDNGRGFRQQPCEPDSPEAGQLREGTFHWPMRCFAHLGSAAVEGVGGFVFIAEGGNSASVNRFRDFAGEAGAALLAEGPPWLAMHRSLDARTLWAAAVLFLSPTARRMSRRHPTGPYSLSNPWAASIAALRDIAAPPSAGGEGTAEADRPPPRVRCEDSDRSVYLDGKRIAGEVEIAIYRFFKAIAGAHPDPISYKEIQRRAPGLHGKHPTRDLKGRLPSGLAALVQSGKHGYSLKLPAPK